MSYKEHCVVEFLNEVDNLLTEMEKLAEEEYYYSIREKLSDQIELLSRNETDRPVRNRITNILNDARICLKQA